jgi:hypothetical protein
MPSVGGQILGQHMSHVCCHTSGRIRAVVWWFGGKGVLDVVVRQRQASDRLHHTYTSSFGMRTVLDMLTC